MARRFADHITGQCFPGNAVLMKAIGGKSEDTVQRAFKALAVNGWLKRTEGRGRGNLSSVIFLMPATIIRHPAQVAATDARAATRETAASEAENSPAEKIADMRFQPKEKAADMREKHRRNAASRIEPNTFQKAQAETDAQWERPAPHLRAVAHHHSDAVNDWDSWLGKRGFPTLERMGILSSDQNGPGYDVPFRRPPSAEDALTTRIALHWATWAAQESEARHDR